MKLGDIVIVKSFNHSVTINGNSLEMGSSLEGKDGFHPFFQVIATDKKFPCSVDPLRVENDTMLYSLEGDVILFINSEQMKVVLER